MRPHDQAVGTTDIQTLKNKSIDGGANTLTNITPSSIVGAFPISRVTNGVDLASVQTLTNKTLDATANTFVNLPGQNMGTPTATASAGTTATAGAETRDAVLGNYAFTAVAGRRYEVRLNGATVSSGTAGHVPAFRIRNGGSSTPTTASTLVAANSVVTPSLLGTGLPVGGTFVPGAGVQTLAVFTLSLAGGSNIIPAATRELYVIDIGLA
jgi:hypothetical protein